MSDRFSERISVAACRRLAAFSVTVAALLRLTGVIILFRSYPEHVNWTIVIPSILLLLLAFGVIFGNRFASAFSLLLCALLTYQLLIGFIDIPWQSLVISSRLAWSMLITVITLIAYLLSMIFLFIMLKKKTTS